MGLSQYNDLVSYLTFSIPLMKNKFCWILTSKTDM